MAEDRVEMPMEDFKAAYQVLKEFDIVCPKCKHEFMVSYAVPVKDGQA